MPAPGANGPVFEIAQPTLTELRAACARTIAGAATTALAAPRAWTTRRRLRANFMEVPLAFLPVDRFSRAPACCRARRLGRRLRRRVAQRTSAGARMHAAAALRAAPRGRT